MECASESRATFWHTHVWEPQMHRLLLYPPRCREEDHNSSKCRQKTCCVLEKVEQRCFGTAQQALPMRSVPPACAPTATTGLVSALGQEGWPECPGAAVQMPDWLSCLPGMQATQGIIFWLLQHQPRPGSFTVSGGQGSAPEEPCQALPFQPLYSDSDKVLAPAAIGLLLHTPPRRTAHFNTAWS